MLACTQLTRAELVALALAAQHDGGEEEER